MTFGNSFSSLLREQMDKENKKGCHKNRKKLANTFRLNDDFTVLKDGAEFGRSFREIYPSELTLKKETDSNKKGPLLDLGIKIEDSFT